jgi:K+ transporter
MSWIGLAYPCLLLAYIGQAAYIAKDPTAFSNPFFQTVPPGTFYFSLVIAILAAIVASQAVIINRIHCKFKLIGPDDYVDLPASGPGHQLELLSTN